jgi:tetratricopeptide (TPR) repeat protein
LLQGLKGNDKSVDVNGHVTVSSLGNYIYDAILHLPATNRPQRPLMKVAGSDVIPAYYPQLAKHPKEITPEELEQISSLIYEGNEYFVQEEYRDAIKYYSAALDINPDSSNLWIKKALAFDKIGDNQDVLYCCKRALEIDPKNVKAESLYHKVSSNLDPEANEIIQANTGLIRLKKYYRTSHAIIIGVSKYKEETSLPNAYNDAWSMMNILKVWFKELKDGYVIPYDAKKSNIVHM